MNAKRASLSACAAAALAFTLSADAFGQTYSYYQTPYVVSPYPVVVPPYAGVTFPSYEGVQQGQMRQDFYGGYNTGPYAGRFGFYRRLPPTSRFAGPSFQRRFNPYTRIDAAGRNRLRHFGGVEFYGF